MKLQCKRLLLKEKRLVGCILLISLSLIVLFNDGFIYTICDHRPIIQTRNFQKSHQNPAADVLLLGYMRGGTTFMGEILGIRKDQFYVYEPLHRIAKYQYFKEGFVCSMTNASCSDSSGNDTEAIDILRNIYNCDFNTFQKIMLPWQFRKVNSTVLSDCEHRDPLCWHQILLPCFTSHSRVSKVLRLTVGLASRLLNSLPHLKILHLVRDPRAIIDSRLRGSGNTTLDEIKSLCQKIKQDCKDSLQMQRKYPGRIRTIFYEDIATSPMEASKVFEFVGFASEMNDFLHINSMIHSSKTEGVYTTARNNSEQTARKWRTRIPWHVIKWTNDECSDVYDLLGYPQLRSHEDLLNSSIPLRT